MRELIALRAKIDLMISDCREKEETYWTPSRLLQTMENMATIKAYEKVNEMIDEMVGKQLEDMYAEHIQEENKADRH